MLFEQETCEKSLSSDEEKVDDGIQPHDENGIHEQINQGDYKENSAYGMQDESYNSKPFTFMRKIASEHTDQSVSTIKCLANLFNARFW